MNGVLKNFSESNIGGTVIFPMHSTVSDTQKVGSSLIALLVNRSLRDPGSGHTSTFRDEMALSND